ncbi:hypothetical protein GCM10011504_27690 [Siccirubricoccus deserti]|nr:hypothetical protein [Siccirubricoccus deserti]GGC47734.1 hypothetical protein GCM10011504_27690 [Siccirubricoccus deserti]
MIPNLSRIDPDAIVASIPAELGRAEKWEALVPHVYELGPGC